ncbi:pyridoxal-phosphate dependent enzyme [Siculibacillus lacustris]|uniref:Cysteine synthase B n=1 Tax=Siculibacillus lacustris TaxID=1549641 RepID=A0A4Q9VW65_9HYPH|nr:pyridoxal-phosphate dependent enzyme [Siculibacillus lacustris]TBW39480.1 pyridoxal-phosphate dependent enzyme [Siculibacillus lacustris]
MPTRDAGGTAARSVLDLIGHTPLVEVTRLDTGPCRLFLKLESWNPGGSIKDRIALSMIEAAEADGRLKPGGVIVEATAGNTGLGLAQVGLPKGYRVILVVPDKMSREKVQHLKALGVDVRNTRSDVGKGHPDYYQDVAARIAAEIPGAFFVDQFANPANPRAHEATTGPEIFEALGGDVDAVVVGVGSGGTLTGLGRYFRSVSPKTKMILADPVGSILAPLITTGETIEPGSWTVEGIGEDFVPPNADLSLVAQAFSISDRESMAAARELLAREGILAGSSSGTLLAAALKWCRAQSAPKRVVSLVCDTGAKYLSKVFNDVWLTEEGLDRIGARAGAVKVGDLVVRRHVDGGTVTVGADDTLLTAYRRMRAADVSQLPVVDGVRLVGLLDESDLLAALGAGGEPTGRFAGLVGSAMARDVRTLAASAPVADLLPLFERGDVAVVVDGDAFLGLVTRVDFINRLRLAS